MVYTLGDRIANRIMRHLSAPGLRVTAKAPIVSFTFDDAPDSAKYNGARILEDQGVRGTFYIAGGLTGQSLPGRTIISTADCIDLARKGHEVGCHTFSHDNVRTLRRGELIEDLDRNRAYLANELGIKARNFAFPFNIASPSARRLLAHRYRTCRGGQEGINRGATDPGYLKSVEIRQPEDYVDGLTRWVSDLVQNPGWLIFFTHDISTTPTPFGCRPETFERLVKSTVDAGCTILPIDQALDHPAIEHTASSPSPGSSGR